MCNTVTLRCSEFVKLRYYELGALRSDGFAKLRNAPVVQLGSSDVV